MVIVAESAAALKGFPAQTGLNEPARTMLLRVASAFIRHRGRMSRSAAAGSVASEPIHRGELTRFPARPRRQRHDFNNPLMQLLPAKETRRGKFLFLIDATLVSQAGKKTQNTYGTGDRRRRKIKKGRRDNKKKAVSKKVHDFTFGLLITPSGIRIPTQMPHDTQEYCQEHGLERQTAAESAAQMIRTLPVPASAEVIVLGDTAYDAEVVRDACEERGSTWIFPANPERVDEGPHGQRPKLRSRLKDWTSPSLKTVRLRASTGKYARDRRLSKRRVGPKMKPRVYYAAQEKREVRRVGRVPLVFSTRKPNLAQATPDDVKILTTNAVHLSVGEVIELYSLRRRIELFFKELKSTLGFAQYRFQNFLAVPAWVQMAIATVLFLEYERIRHRQDRRLSTASRRWWESQRLHGLCHAYRRQCAAAELQDLSDRLKTSGGVARLKRLLGAALPKEYRAAV